MAATGIEVTDLRKLTVVKLRERLSSLGLTTSGIVLFSCLVDVSSKQLQRCKDRIKIVFHTFNLLSY